MHTVAIDIEALLCSTRVKINKATCKGYFTARQSVKKRIFSSIEKRFHWDRLCFILLHQIRASQIRFGTFKFCASRFRERNRNALGCGCVHYSLTPSEVVLEQDAVKT